MCKSHIIGHLLHCADQPGRGLSLKPSYMLLTRIQPGTLSPQADLPLFKSCIGKRDNPKFGQRKQGYLTGVIKPLLAPVGYKILNLLAIPKSEG